MNKKKQKKFLIIIALLIAILAIGIGIGGAVLINADYQANDLKHSQNEVNATEPNLLSTGSNDYFEILGYGQLEISKQDPNINLINSSENNVYLSFDVLYNDELLYESNLISPGQMEQYNIYKRLDAGQHTLTYCINVYDKNENVLWSGIQQEQDILIKN